MESFLDLPPSSDPRHQARQAGKSLAAARHEVSRRLGEFLNNAKAEDELYQRLAMTNVDEVLDAVVTQHMATMTDPKAKLVRSLIQQWKAKHAANMSAACAAGDHSSCKMSHSRWDGCRCKDESHTLSSDERSKRAYKQTCPNCHSEVRIGQSKCPNCGFDPEKEDRGWLSSKTAAHSTSVDTSTDDDGNEGYAASCSCGWSGSHRDGREYAEDDAEEHKDNSRQSSKTSAADDEDPYGYPDDKKPVDAEGRTEADWVRMGCPDCLNGYCELHGTGVDDERRSAKTPSGFKTCPDCGGDGCSNCHQTGTVAEKASKLGFYTPFSLRRLGKDYDDDTRKDMADSGAALPDGSYPIKDCGDVKDAIARFGQGDASDSKTKSHIKKRWSDLKCGGSEPFSSSEGDGEKESRLDFSDRTAAKGRLHDIEPEDEDPDDMVDFESDEQFTHPEPETPERTKYHQDSINYIGKQYGVKVDDLLPHVDHATPKAKGEEHAYDPLAKRLTQKGHDVYNSDTRFEVYRNAGSRPYDDDEGRYLDGPPLNHPPRRGSSKTADISKQVKKLLDEADTYDEVEVVHRLPETMEDGRPHPNAGMEFTTHGLYRGPAGKGKHRITDTNNGMEVFVDPANVKSIRNITKGGSKTADDDEDYEYAESNRPQCPRCGGPPTILGQLGNLKHYRCRNCGTDFSEKNSKQAGPRSRTCQQCAAEMGDASKCPSCGFDPSNEYGKSAALRAAEKSGNYGPSPMNISPAPTLRPTMPMGQGGSSGGSGQSPQTHSFKPGSNGDTCTTCGGNYDAHRQTGGPGAAGVRPASKTAHPAREGMRTPWGTADSVQHVADGIDFVGTPSHGGYHVTPERHKKIHEHLRSEGFDPEEVMQGYKGPWYEEDLGSAAVHAAFPDETANAFSKPVSPEENRRSAHETLSRWFSKNGQPPKRGKTAEDKKRYPGKFEGVPDQNLGENLYGILNEGGADDTAGDVEGPGHHALILDHTNGKHYITHEDNQGFFDYDEYDDKNKAKADWEKTRQHADSFYDDDDERNASVQHTAPGGGEHAPYRLKQEGGKWYVVNDEGEKKNKDGYDSREEALDLQRALYVNVPGAPEAAERDEKKKSSIEAADTNKPHQPKFEDRGRAGWFCSECNRSAPNPAALKRMHDELNRKKSRLEAIDRNIAYALGKTADKEAPTCPECENAKMHYDDHVWVCPNCDYETSEPNDEEE